MKDEPRYKINSKGKSLIAYAVQLVSEGQTIDQAAETAIRSIQPDFDPDNVDHRAAVEVFAGFVALKIEEPS